MGKRLADFEMNIGGKLLKPVIIGGMGVDISTADLALEACKLGGVGHISDAMSPFVSDKKYGTNFTKQKSDLYGINRNSLDKTSVKFDLEWIEIGQRNHVAATMARKKGDGAIFVNVMEKLTMGAPTETLRVRLKAALDAGIDGITLSAGLHMGSFKLMEDNPRFHDAALGIIISSVRALKIFLRSASRSNRMPDYIVVEGPLAGGHLGFGRDWTEHTLENIVVEVVSFLKEEELNIPVIAAGGIFTGGDSMRMLSLGAAGVQVATRFTVTNECGLPYKAKQAYFGASEDEVVVTDLSPTGYPIRMLKQSPCIGSTIKPQCESFGYILSKEGTCQYVDAYAATGVDEKGNKLPVKDKVCLCYHFSKHQCYTCGHNVYKLKDTTHRSKDGTYQLLTAEHVFKDYLYTSGNEVVLPPPMEETVESVKHEAEVVAA